MLKYVSIYELSPDKPGTYQTRELLRTEHQNFGVKKHYYTWRFAKWDGEKWDDENIEDWLTDIKEEKSGSETTDKYRFD